MRINFHFTSHEGENLRTVTRINLKDYYTEEFDEYGFSPLKFEAELGRLALAEVGHSIDWDGGTVYCIIRPENGENMKAYKLNPEKISGFTIGDMRDFYGFWLPCDVPFLPSRGRKVN